MPVRARNITGAFLQPAGALERPLVHRLGPRRVALVEQRPSEARDQRPGEAPESDASLVAIASSNACDRGGVVTGALVEVRDHVERHRQHDRSIDRREAVGGRAVVHARPRRDRRPGCASFAREYARAAIANGSSGDSP